MEKSQENNEKGTHKQHYVPQSYLRRFSNGEKKLFAYDVQKGQVDLKGVKHWCYLQDFYESNDRPFNEIESTIERIESGTGVNLKRMTNGEVAEYPDLLPVLKYASHLDMRSPVEMGRLICILKTQPFWEYDALVEKARKTMNKLIAERRYEKTLCGAPFGIFAVTYTQFKEDILITSDHPLVHCDLTHMLSYKTDESINGYILPIDMKTLFIIFEIEDKGRFSELFCRKEGLIDPLCVNQLVAQNAIEYVFFKDDSEPPFSKEGGLFSCPGYCFEKTLESVSAIEETRNIIKWYKGKGEDGCSDI